MKRVLYSKFVFLTASHQEWWSPEVLVNQRQSTHVRFTMMMNATYYLARFNVAASRRNIIVLRAVLCARKRNVYETKRRSAVHYFYIASHIFHFTSTLCIRNEKFNFSELCRVENASGILFPFSIRSSSLLSQARFSIEAFCFPS